MRAIQTYTFKMSPKTPYSELPEIVHRFLGEQKLVSHRFLYYFDELLYSRTYEETLATGSCAKAVKDCPSLGKIHFVNGGDYGMYPNLFLSNIDSDTGCTEADLLPHMKKIHRRYGFCESNLYYFDVDFFGNVIPWERDLSQARKRSEHFGRECNPLLHLSNQPFGSGVCLHRHAAGGNCVSLSIDLLHNGKICDPTPYVDAMKALLPKIQPRINMEIYLSDAEKQVIEAWNQRIAPLLEQVRGFFVAHTPGKERQNAFVCSYTLAPKLKKLAKQYGFSYRYDGFGVYVLDKRTQRGHVLRLWVDSGPSRGDTTYHVNLQGIGFCHALCKSMQTPTNQAESDACSEVMLSVLSEFEETLLPELDAYYAETPDWFVPSAWWGDEPI